MTAALHLLVSNELKAWPRQRVTGAFVFVREATDGSALLIELSSFSATGPTERAQATVYQVQGISTSLGDLLRANGQSLPQCILLTLIPFMGVIVYDGTLRGTRLPPELQERRADLDATIDHAVESATVVTALPPPVHAPLEGKMVRISGLQAKPELNGQVASAGEFAAAKGRYAVRLSSGGWVTIKPTNLAEASEEEARAAHPPGTLVGSELSAFQREVQEELRAAPSMKPDEAIPGPGGAPAEMSMWVCRRFGYTEAQNPEHTFMVMAGPLPIPAAKGPPIPPGVDPMMAMMMSGMPQDGLFHRASALVPTADDILRAVRSAIANPTWGGRGKPKCVAVDAKEIVARLREILQPAGVEVGYYPPPSNEELMGIPVCTKGLERTDPWPPQPQPQRVRSATHAFESRPVHRVPTWGAGCDWLLREERTS